MTADWPPQSQGKGKKHGWKFGAPLYCSEQSKSVASCTIADCIPKDVLAKLELMKFGR